MRTRRGHRDEKLLLLILDAHQKTAPWIAPRFSLYHTPLVSSRRLLTLEAPPLDHKIQGEQDVNPALGPVSFGPAGRRHILNASRLQSWRRHRKAGRRTRDWHSSIILLEEWEADT